jgi:hypothetical protein
MRPLGMSLRAIGTTLGVDAKAVRNALAGLASLASRDSWGVPPANSHAGRRFYLAKLITSGLASSPVHAGQFASDIDEGLEGR